MAVWNYGESRGVLTPLGVFNLGFFRKAAAVMFIRQLLNVECVANSKINLEFLIVFVRL